MDLGHCLFPYRPIYLHVALYKAPNSEQQLIIHQITVLYDLKVALSRMWDMAK